MLWERTQSEDTITKRHLRRDREGTHSRTHPLYRHEVPHHHHTERSQHGSANVRDERDAPRLELEGAERGSHERKLENAANRRAQVQQVIRVGEESEPNRFCGLVMGLKATGKQKHRDRGECGVCVCVCVCVCVRVL